MRMAPTADPGQPSLPPVANAVPRRRFSRVPTHRIALALAVFTALVAASPFASGWKNVPAGQMMHWSTIYICTMIVHNAQ